MCSQPKSLLDVADLGAASREVVVGQNKLLSRSPRRGPTGVGLRGLRCRDQDRSAHPVGMDVTIAPSAAYVNGVFEISVRAPADKQKRAMRSSGMALEVFLVRCLHRKAHDESDRCVGQQIIC